MRAGKFGPAEDDRGHSVLSAPRKDSSKNDCRRGNKLPSPTPIASTCSHTFTNAGTYPYACQFHAAAFNMTGVVHVVSLSAPPVLTNAVMLTPQQFSFPVLTTANHTNTVQAATNLNAPNNWEAIATIVPTNNSFTFTETNVNPFGIRIYRVVEQ